MAKDADFDLWHYTTAEGLKGILSSQTLWTTDYRYLNDSSEFIHLKSAILSDVPLEYIHRVNVGELSLEDNGEIEYSEKKGPQEIIEDLLGDILNFPVIPYVFSFCRMPKKEANKLIDHIYSVRENTGILKKNGLLSQWRGYGKDGGYAIIFDSEKLIREFETEKQSYKEKETYDHGKVFYGTDKLTSDIKVHFNKVKDYMYETHNCYISNKPLPEKNESLYESLIHCMIFLKHNGFEEEGEYRFCVIPHLHYDRIKIRTKEGTLVPYIELFKSSGNLPIKAICVGPHPDKEARVKSLKAYLGSIRLDNVEVFFSEIPYIGSR